MRFLKIKIVKNTKNKNSFLLRKYSIVSREKPLIENDFFKNLKKILAKYGVTDHYIQYGSFSPYIGPYTGDYKTFCCPASSMAGSTYEGITYTSKEWQCKHAVGMSRTADRKKVNAYINYNTTYNSPSERAIFIDGASGQERSGYVDAYIHAEQGQCPPCDGYIYR